MSLQSLDSSCNNQNLEDSIEVLYGDSKDERDDLVGEIEELGGVIDDFRSQYDINYLLENVKDFQSVIHVTYVHDGFKFDGSFFDYLYGYPNTHH